MNIQPSQQRFLSSTMQDFEYEIIGIPVLPIQEIWGNIFAADPSLKRGGHLMVTNTRVVYCPRDNPGAWVWHFADLQGLSVQASLLKSVITLSMDGADLRWQTLKRGANEVAAAWSTWRQTGSIFANYPEFEVDSPEINQVVRCGKCGAPMTIEQRDVANSEKRCLACYSLLKFID
jgi:hypothetical protein